MSNNALKSELLCIADSKWVLGHWYIKVMMNARTLNDATAFAAMSADELGHTRALFRYMEQVFKLPEMQLEFGRPVDKIHNMEMLDAAPTSWGDFVLTAFLAEAAIWQLVKGFSNSSNQAIATMVEQFGEEGYFHRLNIDGWLKGLTESEKAELIAALPHRLSLAVNWFGEASQTDPLLQEGVRTTSVRDARQEFVEIVTNTLEDSAGIESAVVNDCISNENTASFDALRRRTAGTAMPAELWEYVVPTNEAAQMTRRPLAVQVDDNIDLFETVSEEEKRIENER